MASFQDDAGHAPIVSEAPGVIGGIITVSCTGFRMCSTAEWWPRLIILSAVNASRRRQLTASLLMLDAATSVPLQITHGGSSLFLLVGFIFSLAPAVIGITLLRQMRHARVAAMVYASIALVGSGVALVLVAFNPALLPAAAKPFAPLEDLLYIRLLLVPAIGLGVLWMMRNPRRVYGW